VLGGEDYSLQIIIPNVYFHLTTAYSVLRHNGIDIGKMDFLGPVNFVDAQLQERAPNDLSDKRIYPLATGTRTGLRTSRRGQRRHYRNLPASVCEHGEAQLRP